MLVYPRGLSLFDVIAIRRFVIAEIAKTTSNSYSSCRVSAEMAVHGPSIIPLAKGSTVVLITSATTALIIFTLAFFVLGLQLRHIVRYILMMMVCYSS